ncbi:MAG: DUF1700 domain-containing protein [Oscillospiraceae bacterium]|jgi:uncharacterized membrane protein|nr:DUF1700 domain-containing protein [Oscillospiraceae bacterium]
MTGTEFTQQLSHALRGLPEEEIEAAVAFYEEYFNDAEDETAAVAALGTPGEAAAQIIADYATKPVPVAERTAKRGFRTVWMVLLAVFAAPIGLPIAIAVGAVAFSLIISLAAVLFSVGVSGVACIVAGVVYAVVGIFVGFQSVPTALLTIGAGLAATGIGLALTKSILLASKKCFDAIARGLGRFIQKHGARRVAE